MNNEQREALRRMIEEYGTTFVIREVADIVSDSAMGDETQLYRADAIRGFADILEG